MQDSIRLDFGSAGDKTKSNFTRDKLKNKTFSGSSDSRSPTQSQGPLKEGEHKIWQCEKFDRMEMSYRHDVVKEDILCFSCLGSGQRIGQCKANRTFGENGCRKRYNNLLHSVEKAKSAATVQEAVHVYKANRTTLKL